MNRPLKFNGYTIVFQEVPNEVSLAINISGCPYRCRGCHSKYLWEYKGKLLLNDLSSLIELYSNMITCVCFMGGDQNINELTKAIMICKHYGLRVCLYTGRDSFYNQSIINILDYIKIGSYKEELGGLDNKLTNQKMYRIQNGKLINITDIMRTKY